MNVLSRRFVTAALLGVTLIALGASTAQAQFRVRQWGVYAPGINPNAPFYNRANPFQYVAPGVSLQSALINTVQSGRAISAWPPWAFGYNPYPPINFGPAFQTSGYGPYLGSGLGGGYSPFLSTGYGGGLGYGSSLATGGFPGGYGGSFSTGWDPYSSMYSPLGGALNGAADVLFAEGRFQIQTEQARMMRTQWKVAELDYKKKAFDLDAYIRANTPTFAEVKEKLNQDILRRIQSTASQGEIWSGSAQNVLLRNFAKNRGTKVTGLDLTIPEEVLKGINVTANGGNMGLLRRGGELNWPTGLSELAPKDTKREIDVQTKELYRQADQTGKVDPATAKDLKTNIRNLRERVVAKVNDMPTDQYADAKRFLNDLDDAVRAVERGDAPSFFAFQKFAREGNRSVQSIVDFMLDRGLTFAPSVEGEQAAYQALYQAMAAYNLALNEQLRTVNTTRSQ
jgi:hypothetical protein